MDSRDRMLEESMGYSEETPARVTSRASIRLKPVMTPLPPVLTPARSTDRRMDVGVRVKEPGPVEKDEMAEGVRRGPVRAQSFFPQKGTDGEVVAPRVDTEKPSHQARYVSTPVTWKSRSVEEPVHRSLADWYNVEPAEAPRRRPTGTSDVFAESKWPSTQMGMQVPQGILHSVNTPLSEYDVKCNLQQRMGESLGHQADTAPVRVAGGVLSSEQRQQQRQSAEPEEKKPADQNALIKSRGEDPPETSKGEGVERASRVHRKPSLIPDRFAGDVPWRDYKSHFESCAVINGWSAEEKAFFLAAGLKGQAQQVLGDRAAGEVLDYAELTARLERRYGPGEQAETFLAELRGRTRKENESLQELGQGIRRLTELAYPELPRDSRERLARGYLVDAIPDAEIRAGIFRAHPRTLDEAIRAALETESFLKAERQRQRNQGGRPDRNNRVMRQVDIVSRDEFERQTRIMSEQLRQVHQMLAGLTQAMQSDARRPEQANYEQKRHNMACFQCGKNGHFKRNCPDLQSSAQSGNESGPTQWVVGRSTTPDPKPVAEIQKK